MNERTKNAYNAAIALLTSSTSGWTWAKAVNQVTIAFRLTAEETSQVMYAKK